VFTTHPVALRRSCGSWRVAVPAVLLSMLIVLAHCSLLSAADPPVARPRPPERFDQGPNPSELLEIELETTIGELNKAIAQTEAALANLRTAREVARARLRATRHEIDRSQLPRLPDNSLHGRRLFFFPEEIEKAMMGEGHQKAMTRERNEPRASEPIFVPPQSFAPLDEK
jgi:hypothetical protein